MPRIRYKRAPTASTDCCQNVAYAPLCPHGRPGPRATEQIGLPCPISTGEEALAFYGLQDANVIFSVTLCAVFVIVCRVLQYLFLRFVDQRPRG